MTRGALGRWLIRLLTATGVFSAACSGRYVSGNEDSAGSGGSAIAHGGSKAGAPSVKAGAPSALEGGSSESAAGAPVVEPDPVNPFPCRAPVHFGNPGSGLERCENGVIHRKFVGKCAARAANGAGCLVDADCPPTAEDTGTICSCDASGVGTCVSANCDRDEVCADGLVCAQSDACPYAEPYLGFACQTPGDECAPTLRVPIPSVFSGCVPNSDEVFETVVFCHGNGA